MTVARSPPGPTGAPHRKTPGLTTGSLPSRAGPLATFAAVDEQSQEVAMSGSSLSQPSASFHDPSTFTVCLAGEIDLDHKAELRAVLMGFRRCPAVDAIVDLSAVTFMDSTGVSMLIGLQKAAESREGHVTLVQPSRIVLRVLEITGLVPLFKIVSSS